jgi:hypothetical protein
MRQVSIGNLFMPYCYSNSVGKQMNDYPKAVDEMVDEAFAKSNPTILSAKYFALRRSKYEETCLARNR